MPHSSNVVRRASLRTAAAVWAGKAAGAASRVLGRGGGTEIAGLAALRVDPRLVASLASQAGAGAICVTGTNGKTTTSLMLNRIAAEAGLRPLHNRSGSNLMRGVAAMLVEEASITGAIPDATRRLAILEVDEATLPLIVREVRPRAVVFTNLFRDQLDRYGEVDAVAQSWRRAVTTLSSRKASEMSHPTTLVLNADDPAVAELGHDVDQPVLYYGVDDPAVASDAGAHASDFRSCLRCGAELAYDATHYGHVGRWRCQACGNTRPSPQVRAERVTLEDNRTLLSIATPSGPLDVTLPLAGLYNAYNALAAAAGAMALGLPPASIITALGGFSAAFGRQERFSVDGRQVEVLLGKNPTGLNQVLRAIGARPGEKRLLFILNDGVADGRDISWIWDTDYETVAADAAYVLAAGDRAEDLALRLKYAGAGDDPPVERAIEAALQRAIGATPAGATLSVLPTYTAMLEVRELLAKRSGAHKYWEDA